MKCVRKNILTKLLSALKTAMSKNMYLCKINGWMGNSLAGLCVKMQNEILHTWMWQDLWHPIAAPAPFIAFHLICRWMTSLLWHNQACFVIGWPSTLAQILLSSLLYVCVCVCVCVCVHMNLCSCDGCVEQNSCLGHCRAQGQQFWVTALDTEMDRDTISLARSILWQNTVLISLSICVCACVCVCARAHTDVN